MHEAKQDLKRLKRQRGNILVISIISLVALAGLSVAILSTSVSEKSASHNAQESALAKEAAEYAVTVAKKDLSEKWAVGMCECQTAPCTCPTTAPWVWLSSQFVNADPVDSNASWWNNFGTTVAKPNPQLFSAPQYVIIDLGCDAVANTNRFRIVGRGVGVTQQAVAFSDITFSMPFNTQNVGAAGTVAVNASVDAAVTAVFNMAKFTISNSFFRTMTGQQCPKQGSSFAECEMNCAGQVRVMSWTYDNHCISVYGPWTSLGSISQVTVILAGVPHTVSCGIQTPPPPPPPPGGGTENPEDNGKHKGNDYGHEKQHGDGGDGGDDHEGGDGQDGGDNNNQGGDNKNNQGGDGGHGGD